MILDWCCKERKPPSHSPVLSRFKPYWRQRNNNQKNSNHMRHIWRWSLKPQTYLWIWSDITDPATSDVWPLNLFEDWGFSIGCLLDSNLQIQQSKTWLSSCLPALLSLNNQAGRIVIIALWCLVGCLFNLLHDKFTQRTSAVVHVNFYSQTLTKLLKRSKQPWTS